MLTKVFVAMPGITGHRKEIELDTSKRVEHVFYRSSNSEGHLTPVAYCYKIEHKIEVCAALDKMICEEEELRDRHYRQLSELRRLYGV